MVFRSSYRRWVMLLILGGLAATAPAGEPTELAIAEIDGGDSYGDPYSTRRERYPYSGNTEPYEMYPSAEVQAVPQARASAARARWQYHTTYQTMGRVIRFAKEDFEFSPELQGAVADEAEAYAAYESARRAALRPLADDFQYQTYLMLANDIQRDLENLRATPKPPENELVAMAAVKLNYTTRARDKEVALLSDSQAFNQARERLVRAATRVSKMRGAFDRSLRRNPEVAALRDQLQQDRINKVAAEAYSRAATEARDVGLNYADYVNRDRVYLQGYDRSYYPGYVRY